MEPKKNSTLFEGFGVGIGRGNDGCCACRVSGSVLFNERIAGILPLIS